MAIIEPLKPGSSLSQGDILKGIKLFSSRKGAGAAAHTPSEAKHEMCMVLSRQCAIGHKNTLVVAEVAKYAEDIPVELSFDEIVDFFKTVRDGVGAPDLFYLGNLPNEVGRFCVKLDSVHTVDLPPKPDDRTVYVEAHRVSHLNPDYVRDLHMRILGAFANMGFEDYEWVSDADLQIVVEKGNAEIRKIQDDHRMAGMTRSTVGRPQDLKQIAQEQKTIDGLKKKIGNRSRPQWQY